MKGRGERAPNYKKQWPRYFPWENQKKCEFINKVIRLFDFSYKKLMDEMIRSNNK